MKNNPKKYTDQYIIDTFTQLTTDYALKSRTYETVYH